MISFVTYLSYKTTTVQPTAAISNRTENFYSASGSNNGTWSGSFSGEHYSDGTTSTQFGGENSRKDFREDGTTAEPTFYSSSGKWEIELQEEHLFGASKSNVNVTYSGEQFKTFSENSWTESQKLITKGGDTYSTSGSGLFFEGDSVVGRTTSTQIINVADSEITSSTTGSYSAVTVQTFTTSTTTYTAAFRTTGTVPAFSASYTISTFASGTDEKTTWSVNYNSSSEVGGKTTQTTFTRTIVVAEDSDTTTFITYEEWSKHQAVVADTIFISVSEDRQALGNLAVIKQGNTFLGGINTLPYFFQNTTLSWQPPLTTLITDTRTIYTTDRSSYSNSSSWSQVGYGGAFTEVSQSTTTRSPSSTSKSTTTTVQVEAYTSATFLTASQISFTVEDWVTYTTYKTTSNTETSGTVSTTSYSLNSGYSYTYEGEEGVITNVDLPVAYSYTTGIETVTNVYTTSTSQVDATLYTHEDQITKTTAFSNATDYSRLTFSLPNLTKYSETFGFGVTTHNLPWSIEALNGITVAHSLNLNTSLLSTALATVTLLLNYTSEDTQAATQSATNSNGNDYDQGIFRSGFTGNSAQSYHGKYTSSGSYYSARTPIVEEIAGLYENKNRYWLTSFQYPVAAPVDLNFATNPTRTSGALVLSISGNDHTIQLGYENTISASVFPNEIVLPIYPFFTTILNKNEYGYGAHPSLWSTITLSREGKNFFSTWQSVVESNETTTKYTTESGRCTLAAASSFPHDVKSVGWAESLMTVGGNMQPNSKIFSFEAPGVFLTQSNETNSQFSTTPTSHASLITLQNNTAITVRRKIPSIQGDGIYQFRLIDAGMP
jgi:hypothetical protein